MYHLTFALPFVGNEIRRMPSLYSAIDFLLKMIKELVIFDMQKILHTQRPEVSLKYSPKRAMLVG